MSQIRKSNFRCIKVIDMDHPNGTKADFTVGKEYVYDFDKQAFITDKDDFHHMPHPDSGRDPEDGWCTSDYFEDVSKFDIRKSIIDLIQHVKDQHDLEDEFYLTYIGELNDGDISDWFNNHFDDNVELGCRLGQTLEAVRIVDALETLLENCK